MYPGRIQRIQDGTSMLLALMCRPGYVALPGPLVWVADAISWYRWRDNTVAFQRSPKHQRETITTEKMSVVSTCRATDRLLFPPVVYFTCTKTCEIDCESVQLNNWKV